MKNLLKRIWQSKAETVEVPPTADIGAYTNYNNTITLYVTDDEGGGLDIVLPASLAKLMHAMLGVALVKNEQL